ncbi:MAG TPA: prolipoprotein diacylglyceryl transferase [Candidatus Peribacterales bacterium]|nr:prolipoprotein diacylglyceryl transferase [Candidatus Peribacterales bacterium]
MEFFPNRQIFLEIGPLAIHWYGIMYLLAFCVAWWLIPILARKKGYPLTKDDIGTLLFAGILGVILGGRLGYVLFYAPGYFASHPLEIPAVWNGGMSSHGGMIGVTLAMLIVFRKLRSKVSLFQLADLLTVPIAIGLIFGRLGNFINLELYGTVTDLPWGIAIPGVEGIRHPVQIYAMIKDVFIAIVCFLSLMRSKSAGVTLGLFFLLYGILRFATEFVREETSEGFDIAMLHLTRGQFLTIPVIIIGVWLIWFMRRDAR